VHSPEQAKTIAAQAPAMARSSRTRRTRGLRGRRGVVARRKRRWTGKPAKATTRTMMPKTGCHKARIHRPRCPRRRPAGRRQRAEAAAARRGRRGEPREAREDGAPEQQFSPATVPHENDDVEADPEHADKPSRPRRRRRCPGPNVEAPGDGDGDASPPPARTPRRTPQSSRIARVRSARAGRSSRRRRAMFPQADAGPQADTARRPARPARYRTAVRDPHLRAA